MRASTRLMVHTLTGILAVAVATGCSPADPAPDATRVVFTVESRNSADGEFPPGADRGALTARAAALLVQRLADSGIKDPKAAVDGDSVVVTAGSGSRNDVVALAGAGVLLLRPVGFEASADPAAAGLDVGLREAHVNTPAAEMARRAQQLRCGRVDPLAGGDDPKELLVTCSVDGKTVYSLGAAIIGGTEIESASADRTGDGRWVVRLDFAEPAKGRWSQYTGQHIGKQVAYVMDSGVVSAPMIQSAIAGTTEISGGGSGFSEGVAKHLATVLKSGALPVRLVPRA